MTTASKSTSFDPAQLIADHQAGVWRYLRVLGCDPTEAEDITQETFLAVLEKPFEYLGRAAAASYLRRVAHNLFISVRRRAGKETVLENVEELQDLWTRWAGQDNGEELLEKLKLCMQGLSNRARWALEARFREKKSRVEIAEGLEITEHGAKNLMQRAKRQLRECIQQKMS